MVELDILEALDGIQWLRTGEEVSRHFPISQPTVTRYCKKALRVFDLDMERRDGEWDLLGDPTVLGMERRVHQLARLHGLRRLRLEATYWSASTFCAQLPPGWMLGPSNIVGLPRNQLLLQERIVDAWIAGLPDLPSDSTTGCSGTALSATVLTRMPVFFTCAPNHPILENRSISFDDIADYPTLGLPSGSYPRVEAALKAIGLWNDAVRMSRYRRDRWEGRSEEELVIGYGTPLSMRVSGGSLCRLPLRLPFESGDALVTATEHHNHPRLRDLIMHLQAQLKPLVEADPEIELLPLP